MKLFLIMLIILSHNAIMAAFPVTLEFVQKVRAKGYQLYLKKDQKLYTLDGEYLRRVSFNQFIYPERTYVQMRPTNQHVRDMLLEAEQLNYDAYFKSGHYIYVFKENKFSIDSRIRQTQITGHVMDKGHQFYLKRNTQVYQYAPGDNLNKMTEANFVIAKAPVRNFDYDIETVHNESLSYQSRGHGLYFKKEEKSYILINNKLRRINLAMGMKEANEMTQEGESREQEEKEDEPKAGDLKLLQFYTGPFIIGQETGDSVALVSFEFGWAPMYYFSPNFGLRLNLGVPLLKTQVKNFTVIDLELFAFARYKHLMGEVGFGIQVFSEDKSKNSVFSLGASYLPGSWMKAIGIERFYFMYSKLTWTYIIYELPLSETRVGIVFGLD